MQGVEEKKKKCQLCPLPVCFRYEIVSFRLNRFVCTAITILILAKFHCYECTQTDNYIVINAQRNNFLLL